MNLKHHNRVYILSSKHTYQPMTACVLAQLFYKCLYYYHCYMNSRFVSLEQLYIDVPKERFDCVCFILCYVTDSCFTYRFR